MVASSSLARMIPLKAMYHRLVARSRRLARMIPLTEKYHRLVARSMKLARSSLATTCRTPGTGLLEPDTPITASLGSPAAKYTCRD